MPTAPSTKLEAINSVLSAVGEAPITSLDYIGDSISATLASNIIDEVDRSFQTKGWSFNTDFGYLFIRNASNNIVVPTNTIRINFSETTYPTLKIVQRGTKLYDAKNKTYVFSTNITGDMVSLLSFDLIPEQARNYIVTRSSRIFLLRTRPEEAQNKFNDADEQVAFANFLDYEVRVGLDTNFSKYSTELEALGINQAVFLASSTDDKLKLIQASQGNLIERQARLYYQNRVENKTTSSSDTYASYIEGFRRLGLSEADFLKLDAIQKEEALVIAKNTASSSTSDSRASKFFASGVADKARKLGVRYTEFCQLSNEAQQVFLDGVTNLSEDRFSRYVTNQVKALKIGVRITDFLQFKPEEQEIFLDSLSSASYSDTRAETYALQKSKLDKLGINPPSFFGLKPEEQANLLVAVADVNFSDTRVTSYVTNQTKLKALGIYPQDFFALSYEQQSLVLDAVNSGTYTETRASDYVTNRDKLRKLSINAVDFFSLKPDQQNQLLSVVGNASFDENRASSYITNQAKLKKLGIYPAEFYSLKQDQQYLLLETINSATWSDTRSSDYFTNQDKFRKLGIEPSDFFALKPEQQTLLVENITSYSETRATSYITNQSKLKKIGVWPTEFFSLKVDQQNLLLDTINSASWSDTRATDYVANQTKFKSIGIYPHDFFSLKADQQVLLLESIATFTEDRISRFNTASIQTNLRKLGVDLVKFLSLPKDQQNLILDGASGMDNIISSTASAVTTFETTNRNKAINEILVYLNIPPVSSVTASDTSYMADRILSKNEKYVQSEGWHFNTQPNYKLTKDASGYIQMSQIAYPVLAVDTDPYNDYAYNVTIRNSRLWNLTKSTDVFTSNIQAELLLQLPWDMIPASIQKYIIVKSAKELAVTLNKQDAISFLTKEEQIARNEANQFDSENGDYNIFDSYDVARVLDRGTASSGVF